MEKRECSIRGIAEARGVAEKRRCASCCILVSGIGKERRGTESGIVAAAHIVPERKPTNSRIVTAAGETKKRVSPLCGIAAGIASVGWWVKARGMSEWAEARESECSEYGIDTFRYRFHVLLLIVFFS